MAKIIAPCLIHKKPPKLVTVEWVDAHSEDAWTDIEEIDNSPMVCRTVGYLIKETKQTVSVAGTVSDDGQACCIMHIPRAWIRWIKK